MGCGGGGGSLGCSEKREGKISVNSPLDHKREQAPNFAMSIYVSTLDERRENPYKNTNTSQLL